MHEQFSLSLFGEFRFYRNGTLVTAKEWRTRQARQLLKIFLLEPGRVISARRSIDLLWSEQTDGADKTLRTAINSLRGVLESACSLLGRT